MIKLKLKKRLNQLGLKELDGKMYAYKSHGKPCSCGICRNEKFNRSKMQTIHSEFIDEIDQLRLGICHIKIG